MEFQDFFIATGIGSFPHQDEKDIFRLIFQNFPEIRSGPNCQSGLFWKGWLFNILRDFLLKMERKGTKGMVDPSHGFDKEIEKFYQHLEEGEIKPFEITSDFAKGLRILKDLASKDHREGIKYIKGQISGPITFGLALTDLEENPSSMTLL